MNTGVAEAALPDEGRCDNGVSRDSASGHPLRHHLTRLPQREPCRKIGSWHETLLQRPSKSRQSCPTQYAGLETHRSGFADAVLVGHGLHGWDMRQVRVGLRTFISQPGQTEKEQQYVSAGAATPSQSSDVARLLSAEEASPKPTERHRADLSRKSCACAKGEAPHRLFWRSPVTTAYGGPAPSPKLPEGPANKANELVKRWEEKENDLAQTLKNGQQSKHVVVENVKAAAYSRAPAKTVGVLKKLLRHAKSRAGFGRRSIAKVMNRSENHPRTKEIAFSSW